MKSCAWLFICGVLCAAFHAEPAVQNGNAPMHSIALQNALSRLGLSNEWYTGMLALSKPVAALQLPTFPNVQGSALLQERTKVNAEDELQAAQRASVGTGGANPTYVLPQNPWASNYPFPPPSPYAFNPYSPVAFGYSQPFANPHFAPGGGMDPLALGVPGVGISPDIAAPTANDFFASAPRQLATRDPSFVYPAPNFINPLYVSPRMPNGAFSYYAGFASAIPQGPLSDPTPFPVGDNPPNDPAFKFRQRLRAVAPSFAEEAATSKDAKDTRIQQMASSSDDSQKQQPQQQQSQQQQPQPQLQPQFKSQKRYFRPETVGDPPRVSSGKTKSGTKVALETLKTHECDGCNFE